MSDTSRRQFMGATASAFAALSASGCMVRGGSTPVPPSVGYGDLIPDPAGVLDLPKGFSYRVVSALGDVMDDGFRVPDAADGMGCFALSNGRIALVRNHELKVDQDTGGALTSGYDRRASDGAILGGGTTTIELDARTLKVERQYRSLSGTIRNCAGGITPWGSWLTCEEDVTRAGERGVARDHGWVFDVPADARGSADPVPLTAMGRFMHEAAAVDPATGIVYLTEDRNDSLLYRFLPASRGQLRAGGRLQALAMADTTVKDSRNWNGATIAPGGWHAIRWIDMDHPESPDDDLRQRGAAAGALIFARGEGIAMGDGEVYFACTSGGAAKLGQIFRLRTGARGGEGALQLFYESTDIHQFNFGDNLVVAPDGQLVVCEDAYTEMVDNHLRGITRDGHAYPLARIRPQTEPAGACFSPDGRTMFVNLYHPAKTLAITGPFTHLHGR